MFCCLLAIVNSSIRPLINDKPAISRRVYGRILKGVGVDFSGGYHKNYNPDDVVKILNNGQQNDGKYLIYEYGENFVEVGYVRCDFVVIMEREKDNKDIVGDILIRNIGTIFVYGSSGPNTFDDAGLAIYALKNVGVTLTRPPSKWNDPQKALKSPWFGIEGDVVLYGSSAKPKVGMVVGKDENGYPLYITATQQGTRFEVKSLRARSDIIKVIRYL